MVLAGIMVVSAGVLQVYNRMDNNRVEKNSLEVVSEIEKIFDEQLEQDKNEEEALTQVKNKSVNIKGYNYIGVLYFPSLNNLSIPIISSYSENNLKVSCCRYAGSVEKNNMVIAGHNYKASFGQLTKINNGSTVYFKDMNRTTYKYKCVEILELNPEDVYEMQTGKWDLTLFTCTYNGQKRLTLRFELDGQV